MDALARQVFQIGLGASAPQQLSAPGHTTALSVAALTAVESLARAGGHPIPSSDVAAVQSAGPRPGSGDVAVWAVLAIGAILIVAAWIASLRARPVRRGGRRAGSSPS